MSTRTSTARDIRITDVALRDGSHAKSHQLSVEHVERAVTALDAVGVPVIEVSHGDGLGGSSVNYGFSMVDERELIAAAVASARHAKIAFLLLPGLGVKDDITAAADLGAGVARIATHCTEADIAEQHFDVARTAGLETVGFLMMSHTAPPERLAAEARIMVDSGAQCVYVVDSAGALVLDEVGDRIGAILDEVDGEASVGFHGHQNLSLGVANSVMAIRAGATQIDSSTRSFGAGAGNTPTEALVAVCDKLGIATGVDTFGLFDVAEDVVRPILDSECILDRASLVMGYAGVYSSFLKHAYRVADRYAVSAAEILVEAGRRRLVGGQEDQLIDIAVELTGSRS